MGTQSGLFWHTSAAPAAPVLIAAALALIYVLERVLKLALVSDFFRRPPPRPPREWPSVTMISPLTRGDHDLRGPLLARIGLEYAGPLQHLLVCDQADLATQALVRSLMAAHPAWPATLLLAAPDQGAPASKVAKLQTALSHAEGAVLVFVDDDVSLRPAALCRLLPYLEQPAVGAVFGLACYTAWNNLPASLLSAFVNANALTSYIPLSYLTEPYTITGHCFAMRRTVFAAAGGLAGMAGRVDDDHELARRVRAGGLRCRQTPLVYEVANPLPSVAAANAQLKRWFVLPRQTMAPFLSRREGLLTALASLGNLLPPAVAALSLFDALRGRLDLRPLLACLLAFYAAYLAGEGYLGRRTPLHRLPLLLLTALLTPLHVFALILFSDDTVEWRGRRLHIARGGAVRLLDD